MLNLMLQELTKCSSVFTQNILMERYLKKCWSKENIHWWPDLCAANNGNTQNFETVVDTAEEVSGEVSMSYPYRYTCKKYLSPDHADLIFISVLHRKITKSIKLNNKYQSIEYIILFGLPFLNFNASSIWIRRIIKALLVPIKFDLVFVNCN